MMGANGALLTVVLTLCAVLLVVLIILIIKLINTTDRLNMVLDDAYRKLKSVDGVFTAIDAVSDAVTSVGESIVGKALSIADRLFKKENKEEE